ncbi:hypothetical protein AX14_008213 [Amanita brunnescens Koide BX004]|nr:hypothetical protein AX14_008213 [Amanita brunnescens Koide BX004]
MKVALRLSRRVAWPIKEDLVPLFGPTFPTTCLSPDQPGYGQVVNTGPGRRRSRRPATAPNLSPAASMHLHDPRDNPSHPSWTVVTGNSPSQINCQPLMSSPPTPHISHDNQQQPFHQQQYRRGSVSHHQQTRGFSDRSPASPSVDLDMTMPVSLNSLATPSRERGERVERPPPSASVRYSPYLGHNSYTPHQHKISRRSFSSLSRTSIGSGSADGSGSGEISGGGNSPVAVDIPSLAIQEPSALRPPLHLALPTLRNKSSVLSPIEISPLVSNARPMGSILSRSKSLGQVDRITLPPIRSAGGPLSASATSSAFSPDTLIPYALPPISALEDLRGVNAQDSAAVLRRLTADDEVSPHGPVLNSKPIIFQPQPRQNVSPVSDRYSRYSHNGSDTEHTHSRPDATLSPGGTSPVSPTTPPSAYKDANHPYGSHAILVREHADTVPTPRHRMTGVREDRDEEGTTADMDMEYVTVTQEKAMRRPRSPNAMSDDGTDSRSPPPVQEVTNNRPPHRPW